MLPQFYALLCDAERIKKLLEEGTDPNIRDGDDNTPLHFAASKGCAEVARLLLRHGADPNAQDKSGETPLHVAAYEGYVDVVRLLLEHGADPTVKDRSEYTPLDLAKVRGHRGVLPSWRGGWGGEGGRLGGARRPCGLRRSPSARPGASSARSTTS